MGLVAYIFVLFLVVALALGYYVPRSDREFALRLLYCLLPVQIATLYVLNSFVPFVPSETDTFLYYRFSLREFDSLTDYVDVSGTSSYIDGQFGGSFYTHILTVIHQFAANSLFWRKVLSLAALWPLGFAWYAISRLLAGPRFARTVLAVTVALPTLWYPFCVLLRDLLTASLHSVFLASVLLFCHESRERVRHASVVIATALVLFVLRPITVYIDAAVIAVTILAGSAALASSRRTSKTRLIVLAAAVVAAGFALFMIDEGIFGALQLDAKITPQGVENQATGISKSLEDRVGPVSWAARLAFGTVAFIGSESTIVSPDLDIRDPEQLRGVMNGPWFLVGTPFAALAILTVARQFLLRNRFLGISLTANGRRWRAPSERSNTVETVRVEAHSSRQFGLWVVAGYSLIWLAVCVLSWDWTRWRLPVVPALVMLAVWQYRKLSQGDRTTVAFAWGLAIVGWRLLR